MSNVPTTFPFFFFFSFQINSSFFICNFLDVLNSSFYSRFSLGFPAFLQIYCIFFHFLLVFSSIIWHLHRPLPLIVKVKLRFENMPCGHELALSTKSNNFVYRDEGRRKNNTFFIKMYLSHFILERGWSFCSVRDGTVTGIDLDRLLYWPITSLDNSTLCYLQEPTALLLHLSWGCSNEGRWGQRPSTDRSQ